MTQRTNWIATCIKLHHGLSYNMTLGDEVEDMFVLLNEVKRRIPSVAAVSSGAIASDYQRLRVESVCSRLGLVSLSYLWRQDQSLLLEEMIKSGVNAITVKVAAIGLDPQKHLGKEIAYLVSHLHRLKELYGINVCGEGGEYETLTLDCPLFGNARIVLDEFQIILHSSDPIAPVGILHPLAFHLEKKLDSVSSTDYRGSNIACLEELDAVCEVLGDDQQLGEITDSTSKTFDVTSNVADVTEERLHIVRTGKDDTFSLTCWLDHSFNYSAGLQEELKLVLMRIESQLATYGYSWESVLYVHLYIADMNEFAVANETYVKFITQEKCRFGVPSRSTVQIPLLEVGLGKASIEVLVANDQTKRVLHVQSISCWAPSCIGPYSQATLHKDILHMAGQLGLDPPTMLLCDRGPTAEFEQALRNSEAVANCFNCSIYTSAILFVIYCSTSISESDRSAIEKEKNIIFCKMRSTHLDDGHSSELLNPIFLYVLLPDLPKRSSVEVKPMLYAAKDAGFTSDDARHDILTEQGYWGFQCECWHDTCLQKCIVSGKLCAAVLSVTDGIAAKICFQSTVGVHNDTDFKALITEEQMEKIAKFCIYRLDKVLVENYFTWENVMNLRFYFAASLHISYKRLLQIFVSVFIEFALISQRIKVSKEPIFNLVPVVGAGKSATHMDDILTCELFSTKS